jgi:hypothetical protein
LKNAQAPLAGNRRNLDAMRMIGHSGHTSGFSAYLLHLPDSDISVVFLQNMDRAPGIVDPTTNARKLAAFAIGEPYPAPTPIAMDAAVLQQAQGVYGSDPPGPQEFSRQGARVLRVINGRLTAAHTGNSRSELIPVAVDTFQFHDSFDRLQLVRDAAGAVSALRSFPWGEGEGVLLARANAPPPTAQVALPHAALGRVCGTYLANGMEMRVTLDGEQLKAEVIGQPPAAALIPESPNSFLVDIIDATVEFTPAEGIPQAVVLHQGGDVIEFKRKP